MLVVKFLGATAIGVVGFCLFFAVLGFGLQAFGLATMPWLENKKTEIVRNTNQYVTSDQTALLSDIQHFDTIQANIAAQSSDQANAVVIKQERQQEQDIANSFCLQYSTLPSNFKDANLTQHAALFGC